MENQRKANGSDSEEGKENKIVESSRQEELERQTYGKGHRGTFGGRKGWMLPLFTLPLFPLTFGQQLGGSV